MPPIRSEQTGHTADPPDMMHDTSFFSPSFSELFLDPVVLRCVQQSLEDPQVIQGGDLEVFLRTLGEPGCPSEFLHQHTGSCRVGNPPLLCFQMGIVEIIQKIGMGSLRAEQLLSLR